MTTRTIFQLLSVSLSMACALNSTNLTANDFTALDQALPASYIINGTEPIFDFDGDG